MTESPAEPDAGVLPPPRAPLGARTWCEIAHLLANLPLGVLGFVYVTTCLYVSGLLSVTVIGLPLFGAGAHRLSRGRPVRTGAGTGAARRAG